MKINNLSSKCTQDATIPKLQVSTELATNSSAHTPRISRIQCDPLISGNTKFCLRSDSPVAVRILEYDDEDKDLKEIKAFSCNTSFYETVKMSSGLHIIEVFEEKDKEKTNPERYLLIKSCHADFSDIVKAFELGMKELADHPNVYHNSMTSRLLDSLFCKSCRVKCNYLIRGERREDLLDVERDNLVAYFKKRRINWIVAFAKAVYNAFHNRAYRSHTRHLYALTEEQLPNKPSHVTSEILLPRLPDLAGDYEIDGIQFDCYKIDSRGKICYPCLPERYTPSGNKIDLTTDTTTTSMTTTPTISINPLDQDLDEDRLSYSNVVVPGSNELLGNYFHQVEDVDVDVQEPPLKKRRVDSDDIAQVPLHSTLPVQHDEMATPMETDDSTMSISTPCTQTHQSQPPLPSSIFLEAISDIFRVVPQLKPECAKNLLGVLLSDFNRVSKIISECTPVAERWKSDLCDVVEQKQIGNEDTTLLRQNTFMADLIQPSTGESSDASMLGSKVYED